MKNLKERRKRMFDLVDQWRTSGLNQRLFCNKHGVKLATLSYWVSKVRHTSKAEGVFVPVLRHAPNREIALTCPNGVSLNVCTEDLASLPIGRNGRV